MKLEVLSRSDRIGLQESKEHVNKTRGWLDKETITLVKRVWKSGGRSCGIVPKQLTTLLDR